MADPKDWSTSASHRVRRSSQGADVRTQGGPLGCGVPNVRNLWDIYTRGGATCLGEAPPSLIEIDEAVAYLDGSAAKSFDMSRALRMLFLLRHERACQERSDVEWS